MTPQTAGVEFLRLQSSVMVNKSSCQPPLGDKPLIIASGSRINENTVCDRCTVQLCNVSIKSNTNTPHLYIWAGLKSSEYQHESQSKNHNIVQPPVKGPSLDNVNGRMTWTLIFCAYVAAFNDSLHFSKSTSHMMSLQHVSRDGITWNLSRSINQFSQFTQVKSGKTLRLFTI